MTELEPTTTQLSFDMLLPQQANKIKAYDPDWQLINELGVALVNFTSTLVREMKYRAKHGDDGDYNDYFDFGFTKNLKHKMAEKYDLNLFGLPVAEWYPGTDEAYLIRCQLPVVSADYKRQCLTEWSEHSFIVKPWDNDVCEYVPDWPEAGYGS